MDILNETPIKMSFKSSGTPVDPELRPVWRISILVIILSKLCRGSTASLKKLQVIYAIISSHEKRESYLLKRLNSEINVRFDPLLDRAISIGVGEGFFEFNSAKSVTLTKIGKSFSLYIYKCSELFVDEKEFLEHFSKTEFSDEKIDMLLYKGLI
ncbi:hypothetical protein ACWXVW_05265 [Pantoea dispersa]